MKHGEKYQSELIDAIVETQKYGRTTIKNALSELEEEKLIMRKTEGRKKICRLVNDDLKKLGSEYEIEIVEDLR